PLNPRPRLDLAAHLRRIGESEQAIAHLRTARALGTPVDSLIAIEASLALAEAEAGLTPSATLGSPAALFLTAWRAARDGNREAAASAIRQLEPLLNRETLDYLLADPALKHFHLSDATPSR
ncbi:MAG: hypothetical protein N2322_07635, partial [Terrimicrobiaceae bacterium]|nr:hypothetical protein [Terrimicrobiaceae bacterium]